MNLQAPTTLKTDHQTHAFSCGKSTLDEWLKRKALANQTSGASRTFVVSDDRLHVLGYDALAAGAVTHQGATRFIRQNMPNPIPVMVLARLAIDVRAQGKRLGAALLQDAVFRSVQVSQHTGVRALLVHALNDRARQFYLHFGFQPSPIETMTLMLKLNSLQP